MTNVVEIALFTDDVEAAASFYCGLLGAEPVAQWPGGAIFAAGDTKVLVHEREAAMENGPPNEDHFAFSVVDLDEACDELRAQGTSLMVRAARLSLGSLRVPSRSRRPARRARPDPELVLVHALRGAGEACAAALESHEKVAPWKVNDNVAVIVGRCRDCDGTRSGRRCLPHSALPDARRNFSQSLDPNNLNVGAVGEPWMRLEQGSDALDLVRVSDDDRVRVSYRDPDECNPVDDFRWPDPNFAEVLLDLAALEHRRDDFPLADTNRNPTCAAALGEPGGGNASSVARELGLRAVGIPDDDAHVLVTGGDDLDDAIGVACEVVSLRRV